MLYRMTIGLMLLLFGVQAIGQEDTRRDRDEETIEGTWETVLTRRGKTLAAPSAEEAEAVLRIRDGKMRRTVVGIPLSMSYTLRSDVSPGQIDMESLDNGRLVTSKGLYILRPNVLIIKLGKPPGADRPTTVEFDPDENAEYWILGRLPEPAE